MNLYTPNEIDKLAELGSDTVCFKPGGTVPYDVENYERIHRRTTRYGGHKYYEIEKDFPGKIKKIPRSCMGREAYLLRIGGLRRSTLFLPDEIAPRLRTTGFHYADGVGNGIFESLLLCRKYGIWPIFEAPCLGFTLPFLKSEFAAFQRFYRRKVQKMKEDIRIFEKIFGGKIMGRKNQPWILWLKFTPLPLYLSALERDAQSVIAEMERAIGIRKAKVNAKSIRDRADLARFWWYLREKHLKVLLVMSQIFRQEIVKEGLIIGNMHANPPTDYATLGEVFDFPGLAVRPGYIEREDLRSSYVAYAIKLFYDLSGRPPLVSIRSNLLSAGSRFIPGRNVLHAWYSAAIRSGAGGFYFWPRDYPSGANGPANYDGAMCGNPDPATRGRERWEANLEICSRLANIRRFIPPPAPIAVLVPYQSIDNRGWKRVFDAYRVFEQARIWVKFVDTASIERGVVSLKFCKLLVIPVFAFCSRDCLQTIAHYVLAGGHIVAGERKNAHYDLQGKALDVRFHFLDVEAVLNGRFDLNEHRKSQPIIWHEPALGSSRVNHLSGVQIRETAEKMKRLCRLLSIEPAEWVYDLTVDNIAVALGRRGEFDPVPTHPELTLEHYFYEHSSNWILPSFVDKPEETYA